MNFIEFKNCIKEAFCNGKNEFHVNPPIGEDVKQRAYEEFPGIQFGEEANGQEINIGGIRIECAFQFFV